MRVLANENFPGEAIGALRERGHDIVWIRTEAPGSKDQTILQRAQIEKRILVNLLFIQGFRHPVELFCFRSQPRHQHLSYRK